MPARGKSAILKVFSQAIAFVLVFIALTAIFLWSPGIVKAQVVINEVMWMGTTASDADEWLELKNETGNEVSLNGWILVAEDGTPSISLGGTIVANGFFLLERTDDTTVSDIDCDQQYAGNLGNEGEKLILRDSEGQTIDMVDASSGWRAGDNTSATSRASMERKDGSWVTNDGVTICGRDAQGNAIKGTPRAVNSAGREETPTATPTPTPKKDTFVEVESGNVTLNQAKNEEGQALNNVKIYVDDQYVHHYTPEVLTFGDDKYCYQNDEGEVDCGFGQHVISLEKSGYQKWSRVLTVDAGDNQVINPVMVLDAPTTFLDPTLSPTATVNVEITSETTQKDNKETQASLLSISDGSEADFFPLTTVGEPTPEVLGASNKKRKTWPLIILGLGLFFLFVAAYCLWYNFDNFLTKQPKQRLLKFLNKLGLDKILS